MRSITARRPGLQESITGQGEGGTHLGDEAEAKEELVLGKAIAHAVSQPKRSSEGQGAGSEEVSRKPNG